MYISLSSSKVSYACAISQSIIDYVGKGETQFFDWLVCSLKSVNEILEGISIEIDKETRYFNNQKSISVQFKGCHQMTSHHDLPDFSEESIIKMNDKYKRRYIRLIDNIKSITNIKFIRYCRDNTDIEEAQIFRFYDNIKKINNDSNFSFILVTDNNDLNISKEVLELKQFRFINLNNEMDDDTKKESASYSKIVKSYKCIYSLENNVEANRLGYHLLKGCLAAL